MGWGNCIMRKVHKDGSGVVTAIDGGEEDGLLACCCRLPWGWHPAVACRGEADRPPLHAHA